MVVVNYRNSDDAAEELCSTIQSNGGRAHSGASGRDRSDPRWQAQWRKPHGNTSAR